MSVRGLCFWLLGSIAFHAAAPGLAAQPVPPRTYSLVEVSRMTELSLFSPNPADLRLYRDGSRGVVELSIPPAAVNGIPARVAEFRGADGRVESRAWIAEPGGFLVKSEMVGGDGTVVTLLEVKKVDFAKRTDLSLDLPSNCDHQTAGEWSSTGVSAHEEASATVQGSGSVDLGTNRVRGEAHLEQPVVSKAPVKPGPAPASPASLAEPAKVQVTAVRSVGVRPRPDYKGEYPGQFEFVFAVTSDGPAEVKYVLVNQADRAWLTGTISFAREETKEVVLPVKVGVRGQLFEGWTKLEVSSPNKIESERVSFSVDCRK